MNIEDGAPRHQQSKKASQHRVGAAAADAIGTNMKIDEVQDRRAERGQVPAMDEKTAQIYGVQRCTKTKGSKSKTKTTPTRVVENGLAAYYEICAFGQDRRRARRRPRRRAPRPPLIPSLRRIALHRSPPTVLYYKNANVLILFKNMMRIYAYDDHF